MEPGGDGQWRSQAPSRLLAGRAVDMLAAKMRNPRVEAHALERPELIVRESTSAA